MHPEVPVPTPAEVDEIAAMTDPVARNYRITACYQRLSEGMARRTGPCANWCTFATWASAQAGQTIRREDFQAALERFIAVELDLHAEVSAVVQAAGLRGDTRRGASELGGVIRRALHPEAMAERASEAVAAGNRKVFAEIGREFARFAVVCQYDSEPHPEHLHQFVAGLQSGGPPHGQDMLRDAFTRYYAALFEPEDSRKAQLMLHANLLIGYHEQTRLQPEIAQALEAAIIDPYQVGREIVQALFPRTAGLMFFWIRFWRLNESPTALDRAVNRLVTALRLRLRHFLTERIMTLELPKSGKIALGTDLSASFPPLLATISDPELRDFLAGIDPTPDSVQQTGAKDWANFTQRMHFIADLFRCYQY